LPRITKVYTRTGDHGDTGLGGGQRVPKDSRRIEAYGTVDELNSAIGAAIAANLPVPLKSSLERIQHELFDLGSDLCFVEEDKAKYQLPQLDQRHIDTLEREIDTWSESLEPLRNFILPGGTPAAAQLHVARTVCRRAERRALELSRDETIGPCVVKYLNRLSDALFVMARFANRTAGTTDVLWHPTAPDLAQE
jgi:cob(I)alamin adenosyltransferase